MESLSAPRLVLVGCSVLTTAMTCSPPVPWPWISPCAPKSPELTLMLTGACAPLDEALKMAAQVASGELR
jgi:hypothetical protein